MHTPLYYVQASHPIYRMTDCVLRKALQNAVIPSQLTAASRFASRCGPVPKEKKTFPRGFACSTPFQTTRIASLVEGGFPAWRLVERCQHSIIQISDLGGRGWRLRGAPRRTRVQGCERSVEMRTSGFAQRLWVGLEFVRSGCALCFGA